MRYFTPDEVRHFFQRDPDSDSYFRIFNVAHEFEPLEALAAVEELLDQAQSQDDISLIGACCLEPVVDLRYHALGEALVDALGRNRKLREALRSVITSQMPDETRERLDAITGE